ncbi:MAG: YcjF family protein [Coriobacteriales bacterium]|jgi:uncharacterized protein (DUF697 family)
MSEMPIDFKGLLDSVANVGQERDVPVYVDLVFDPTASDRLIDEVLAAFSESDSEAFVEKLVLETTVPDLPVPCDLCVIVGGDSLLLGDVAAAARSKGIPAVVAIERGKTYFSHDPKAAQAFVDATIAANETPRVKTAAGTASAQMQTVGRGIPVDDIIDIDLNAIEDRPLEELGEWIVSNAPAKRIAMAADFPFLRHPLAADIIRRATIQNGAVSVVFFVPGADMPVITLNQVKMALQIAAAYGNPMGSARIKEVAAIVAGGFGFRGIARKLVSLVPVLSWAIKPAVSASGTFAMGQAAIGYYEGGLKQGDLAHAGSNAVQIASDGIDKTAEVVEKVFDGFLAHRPRKKAY